MGTHEQPKPSDRRDARLPKESFADTGGLSLRQCSVGRPPRSLSGDRSAVPVGNGPQVIHELLRAGELAEGQALYHLDHLAGSPVALRGRQDSLLAGRVVDTFQIPLPIV